MSNVVPFSRPHRPREVVIHWAEIAFMPLEDVERNLTGSAHWDNPLLFVEVVRRTAVAIAAPMSDDQAQKYGWADAATAQARADDLQRLIQKHLARCCADGRKLPDL